ncbi:hypothetical protein K3725_15065 [Leisingera sp. S132]|uniref:hypothetical protein n=1 Tax=Leisingera sp. S132 TaxID=2867016 RepID=UPI0021A37D38|nr:hypothetical protein [Leisingera sp. S132]UWQ78617.1 hypothetical protein K3725_15065 [Leisingera sp. S132]
MILHCDLRHPVRRFLHSADIDDMRAAILDDEEDDDGPDGGSPHICVKGRRRAVAAAGTGSCRG